MKRNTSWQEETEYVQSGQKDSKLFGCDEVTDCLESRLAACRSNLFPLGNCCLVLCTVSDVQFS